MLNPHDLSKESDDQLARGPLPPQINADDAMRIARMALHITLAHSSQKILDPMALRRWEERSGREHEKMATSVIRVLQALQLLGYLTE